MTDSSSNTDSSINTAEKSLESTVSTEQQKKGRRTLLLILAVFILPFFILPLVMSPDERTKTNKGTLIQPHIALSELPLTTKEGGEFDRGAIDGKWLLMYVMPDNCDKRCHNSLLAIRQVKKSLDRDINRVEHLLVRSRNDDPVVDKLLTVEFSNMLQAWSSRVGIDPLFHAALDGAKASDGHFIYIVSPDGYVFLSYSSHEDEREAILKARDIRKDLKKSMKGSLKG